MDTHHTPQGEEEEEGDLERRNKYNHYTFIIIITSNQYITCIKSTYMYMCMHMYMIVICTFIILQLIDVLVYIIP